MPNPLIALLTDFGTRDHYVGVMKGVMKGICPDADFIDITHEVPPQDVRAGAFALSNAYPYFPASTVFLAVVDPGVGTARKPIAIRYESYFFVAPDNGLLARALHIATPQAAITLDPARPDYFQLPVSNTFHGRDVFAPAAAHIAAGVPLERLGAPLDQLTELPPAWLARQEGQVIGEVVYIDHFGNIITNIGELDRVGDNQLRFDGHIFRADAAHVDVEGRQLTGICQSYGMQSAGRMLTLVSSGGYLEIAVNQGNAAERLGVQPGDRVVLRFGDGS